MRAIWKGHLTLTARLSCAVALHTATRTPDRISFHALNRATGNRVKRQYVDARTGEPVADEDLVKGYAVGKDSYILVEDAELEALRPTATATIAIDAFLPAGDVDARYREAVYYLVPDDKVGLEAYAAIRDALRGKALAGLARMVLGRRDRVVLIEPLERGLTATALRPADEQRGAEPYLDPIPDVVLPPGVADEAGWAVVEKTVDAGVLPELADRYETALVELIRRKQMPPAPRRRAARDQRTARKGRSPSRKAA